MTEFTVVNHATEKTFVEDTRADAEARATNGVEEFGFGESDIDVVQGAFEEYDDVEVHKTDGGDPGTPAAEASTPEVMNSPEPTDPGGPEVSEVDPTEQLPNEKPSVDTDPLTWMPSEFTDTIDGTVAINRKGYEVMAQHYGIGTSSKCMVGPEQTDFEFCRVQATATTADGVEYQAHGSASTERGDDAYLLLEMADTRARKRAVAQATGVGMVAVEELQNEL